MQHRRISARGILGILSVTLILTLLLAACSDSSPGDDGENRSDPLPSAKDAGGPAEVDEENSQGEDGDASEGELSVSPSSPNYVANQEPFDRLIIRTVEIDLTVIDVAQGSSWIRDLASRKDGFVFSSNTYVRDESEFAEVTIRIPADRLDSTVSELRDHDLVIQVDSEESTSQDVSQEYVDNESRLEALEETERRFLALLSEADTVEEILRIEAELTNIRSQIETIKGRQNYLDQMTSLSTITITMHGESADLENEDGEESFIARIFGDSWDSASGVIEGLLGGAITLSIVGLAVLPFALLVYALIRITYRRLQYPLFGRPSTAQPSEETPS